ncbi:MAG TPA: MotA/TolQ/ExbB proton channel family protein, partial [Chthoniobacteraceae bacterium]|nr:MotA/TolQ/ExbB proton channel family protein [Chthoniobacteraceae bacterium]
MKFIVYLLATAISSPALLAQDASPTTAPAKEAAGNATMNLFEMLKDGGWAMIPLAGMSVLTVMLVLVYLVTLRRSAIATSNFMNTADVLLKKRDYHGLLAIANRHGEMAARIVQRTLEFATRNPKASYNTIREIAQTEGATLAASLQHRIVYLADIAMLSPMVGLLGTVLGIVKSFHELFAFSADAKKLMFAGGISQALVCTAAGLIIGIIAMAFYSLFRGRVQNLVSDLEIASTHILGLLALDYNKMQDTSSKAF